MTEEPQTAFKSSTIQQEPFSQDNILDENFFSPQIRPENIFCDHQKDTSEVQLSTEILNFPFTLKFYELIHLKDETDPELNDSFCSLILGDFKKVRYSESILKMIFFSKEQSGPLNLNEYIDEIKSLKNILGIEFICLCKNKMLIQFENENMTKDNFASLQNSYSILDFLYDEDYENNSSSKEKNNLFSSEKKFNNDFKYIDDLLSSEKKGKKLDFNDEYEIKNSPSPNKIINKNEEFNYNLNESDLLHKNKDDNNLKKINISNESPQKINNQNQSSIPNNFIPPLLNPQLFPQYFSPMNNISKVNPQINPLLFLQLSKINPLVLQTALFMQNMLKMQQMNQKNNEIKNNNFNGKNNKINNETEKIPLPKNIKDFSIKSNTSSTTSSKESSPASNYQDKANLNNINKINIPSINFGLFDGFNNNNIPLPNLNTINNNKLNNYKESLNDILNISKSDNKNNKSDSSQNTEDSKSNVNTSIYTNSSQNNYNLEKIVIDNKYKEFIPKKSTYQNNIFPNNIPSQTSEKEVAFHTNSTRDYQYKYVSRYIVQIENDKNFPVTRMIIGNSGKLLRDILVKNCIKYGDYTTKIRLRGKGSGYKEGPKNEESNDPMELCISSLNMFSYVRCSNEIENLLKNVYYQYYLYQCNNKDKNNNEPIVMKKILKYPYVVNRINTLVKEEKRRKKEEELKQINQENKNDSNNNNNNDDNDNNDNDDFFNKNK